MIYEFSAEIGKGSSIVDEPVSIQAESEERAREHASHVLEEKFPGEQGNLLLSLELVSTREE